MVLLCSDLLIVVTLASDRSGAGRAEQRGLCPYRGLAAFGFYWPGFVVCFFALSPFRCWSAVWVAGLLGRSVRLFSFVAWPIKKAGGLVVEPARPFLWFSAYDCPGVVAA